MTTEALRSKIKPILGWRPSGMTTMDQTSVKALEEVFEKQLDAILNIVTQEVREKVIGEDVVVYDFEEDILKVYANERNQLRKEQRKLLDEMMKGE